MSIWNPFMIDATPVNRENFEETFLATIPNQMTLRNGTQSPIFPNLTFNRILAPVVEAHIKKSQNKIFINAIVPIDYNPDVGQLPRDRFKIKYLLSRNTNGMLELVLFIKYENKEMSGIVGKLNLHAFSIQLDIEQFTKSSIVLPGETLKLVKLFQMNENPKTSRGTETGVQEDD